jgi:hypothetical protein
MREFAGARFGVSREELGKWNEEGFTAKFAKFAKLDRWWIKKEEDGKSCQDRPHESSLANLATAVQILLGLGCGVVRELLIVERW